MGHQRRRHDRDDEHGPRRLVKPQRPRRRDRYRAGRGGGTPRAAPPPAPRFGPQRPSRAPLENGAAVSSAPRPLGFESPQCAQNHNGPVAGADIALVGAVGLEPTIPKAEDFKSPAYANSATPPCRESVPRCASHGHVLGFPSRTNNDAVNRPAHRFGKITPCQGVS